MRADLAMVNGTLIRWIALSGTDGLSSMYVRFCSEEDEGRQTRILAVHVDAHPVPGVKGCAVCVFGLGPFCSRDEYRFDDVQMIAIRHFHKGIPDGSTVIRPSWRHKEMSSLRLVMDDETGRHVNIEVVPAKRHGLRLETMANAIAAYTHLPLDIDRQTLERGLRR